MKTVRVRFQESHAVGGVMKIADLISARIGVRLISGCLTFALLVSSNVLALPGPQEPAQQPPSTNQADPATAGVEPLPDSPGSGKYQTIIAQAGGQADPAQSSQPQSSPPPPPPPAQAQKPVGTAAAETTTTTGFAVSRPAGAALAPAKQKRSRTILISVAAVVGAAVAVGTVAALSKGTPSKPPGAQ
jgi:hypothetical protein